ncbi:mannose-6-phosphate isomerase, class I [Vibrio marisflavi]|uniref:mannose-6-phosphate isomerase n=1 Tax=Vibrio marisflavi CECT 7928 TaxID=634439 RepID=A0ABN8DXA3_9VIBR|nr:mannose-6-phosphate isomerase, class I [Vibrio marisflavi]CAH0536189.1 Mannose-6-phosphate isomerase [Vibrio marisflavi CECT 7928]
MSNQSTPCFFPMNNVIQNYAWGSKTSIHELFGIENSQEEPQAEIWMGAHPNGCSEVQFNGNNLLLSQLIDNDKAAFLSLETAEKFGQLPYLFKVLAAASALSIQVHPSKEMAEQGFAKEELQGIPLKAAHRNYKDPNHKPELVFALTDYQAMNGFRNFDSIISLFKQANIEALEQLVAEFASNVTSVGLRSFFTKLLSLEGDEKALAVAQLMAFAEKNSDSTLYSLILKLEKQYPGDIGLFAPLMLNIITLKPGEAMYLDALTPHAYIEGTGLEIMANSDNVLRAGLTPKHMDVEELVGCTLFQEKPEGTLLLKPQELEGAQHYAIPVPDFNFSVYTASEDRLIEVTSAEILLPIDEALVVKHESGESITIEKGQSVFIPAYTKSYTLSCAGRVARAYN